MYVKKILATKCGVQGRCLYGVPGISIFLDNNYFIDIQRHSSYLYAVAKTKSPDGFNRRHLCVSLQTNY